MKFIVAIVFILPLVSSFSVFPSVDQCKVVDGDWGKWENWQPCSVTCESGFQKRYRHCDSPRLLYDGKQCSGNHLDIRECNSGRKCPQEGGWSKWKVGKCSVTCGIGDKVDKRFCNSPSPKHCGKCCGENKRVRTCVMPPCPDDIPIPFEGCKKCSIMTKGMLPCKVDKYVCQGKKLGVRKMYPANNHYFLHCSPDGPWCKPCAEKTLVYNARCEQCEATRNGTCTRPKKPHKKIDITFD